jgi:hypothetical protein
VHYDSSSASNGTSFSASSLALVPTARLERHVTEALAFFGETGLGFMVTWGTHDQPFRGANTSSGATGLFRIGGGATYAINSSFALYAEPLAVDLYMAKGASAWSILVGPEYRP